MENSLTALKVLDPVLFYNRFAEQNTRPDGRSLLGYRTLHINKGGISTVEGSASVRLGGTTIISAVTCECIRQQCLYTIDYSSDTDIPMDDTESSKESTYSPLLESPPYSSSSSSSTSSSSSSTSSTSSVSNNDYVTISVQIPEFRNGHNQYVSNSTKAQDLACTFSKILQS